jgi:lysozyme family protein
MSFEDALQFVLHEEGGFVNNPDDPGGATNHGITQATYDRHRANRGVPSAPVSTITAAEVSEIYRAQYWNACRCADIEPLDARLALIVFETAVNSGVGQASKILQRLLQVTPDGQIGLQTIAALGGRDLKGLVEDYLWARLALDAGIARRRPKSRQFLLAWVSRVLSLRQSVQP